MCLIHDCLLFCILLTALDGEEGNDEQIIDDDMEKIDESTRKFNFWTHQIHIFFVCKFFPAAEKFVQMKKSLNTRKLAEARKQLIDHQKVSV